MKLRSSLCANLIAVLAFGALVATPVLAAPPGHSQNSRQVTPSHDNRGNPPPQHQTRTPTPRQHHPATHTSPQRPPVANHFDDQHRGMARSYYTREFSGRNCPPGLTRKGNSCVPTHSDRAWFRGHPLPRSVIFYDLPPSLVVELGPPPFGYRYVRVAGDILMIAVGTGLVVDAIQDIFR